MTILKWDCQTRQSNQCRYPHRSPGSSGIVVSPGPCKKLQCISKRNLPIGRSGSRKDHNDAAVSLSKKKSGTFRVIMDRQLLDGVTFLYSSMSLSLDEFAEDYHFSNGLFTPGIIQFPWMMSLMNYLRQVLRFFAKDTHLFKYLSKVLFISAGEVRTLRDSNSIFRTMSQFQYTCTPPLAGFKALL